METCKCSKCPFGGRKVGNRGPIDAPIVFLGESPGIEERKKGIPFVGPSGKLLWKALPKGIDPDKDILTINAMQCFPRKRGKDAAAAMEQAVNSCRARVLQTITAHPRKVVVALGAYALASVTNSFDYSITRERGRLIPSELAEYGILPSVHPAYLLRGKGSYRQFKNDIQYAFHLLETGEPYTAIEPKVIVCDTIQKAYQAACAMAGTKVAAADIETTSLKPRTGKILSLAISPKPEVAYVFTPATIRVVAPILASRTIKWIWHNGKFDVGYLRHHKINARVDEDTMLLSYALDETPGLHSLEQLASDYLGADDYKDDTQQYVSKKLTNTFADIPPHLLYARNGKDASYTLQIFKRLREEVADDHHLERLYTKTLIPASELLTWVEARGLYVNTKQVEENRVRLEAEVANVHAGLEKIAGRSFNPNSPKQVADILFNQFRLPRRHGASTGKDVLKKLPKHPFVVGLQEHRIAAKALSTYVYGVLKAVADDGCVHTTYKIHGSRTGRLASAEPNVQNIPRKKELRGMFMARPGRVLVEVDLNQAELRCLAALSKDDFLCHIYNSTSLSLHVEVSKDFFGPNFTDEQKMRAKAVNFGIVYGREPPSIAEEFDISIEEAQGYITKWFKRAPKAKEFIMKCRFAPLRNQTMVTPFGRKKRHQVVAPEIMRDLMNEAANFPHQSIASDVNLEAAIECAPKLRKMDVWICNLIHDSNLLDCPNNPVVIAKAVNMLKASMEAIPRRMGITRVPFKADAKIGTIWGQLKEPEKQAA